MHFLLILRIFNSSCLYYPIQEHEQIYFETKQWKNLSWYFSECMIGLENFLILSLCVAASEPINSDVVVLSRRAIHFVLNFAHFLTQKYILHTFYMTGTNFFYDKGRNGARKTDWISYSRYWMLQHLKHKQMNQQTYICIKFVSFRATMLWSIPVNSRIIACSHSYIFGVRIG